MLIFPERSEVNKKTTGMEGSRSTPLSLAGAHRTESRPQSSWPDQELPLLNVSPLPDRTNLLASITHALTHAPTLDTVLLRSTAKEAKSHAFCSMQIVGQSRLC
jgi:hypothetical protein